MHQQNGGYSVLNFSVLFYRVYTIRSASGRPRRQTAVHGNMLRSTHYKHERRKAGDTSRVVGSRKGRGSGLISTTIRTRLPLSRPVPPPRELGFAVRPTGFRLDVWHPSADDHERTLLFGLEVSERRRGQERTGQDGRKETENRTKQMLLARVVGAWTIQSRLSPW